jgi:hypothetical protein
MRLYLERSGIVEDWIRDDLEIEVADGDFFGSGQNTPEVWQGQVVLVRHSWDIAGEVLGRESVGSADETNSGPHLIS